jgi:hypothetical protein
MIRTIGSPTRSHRRWVRAFLLTVIVTAVLAPASARQANDPRPTHVVGGLQVAPVDGPSRITLELNPKLGTITTWNTADGIPGIVMAVRSNGDKNLMFSDPQSDRYITINLLADGTASISMFSTSRQGVDVTASNEGTSIDFKDKNRTVRIRLGLQKDGTPGMEFFDAGGKRTYRAAAP